MNNRVRLIAFAALFSHLVSAALLPAQESRKPQAPPATPSIQRQIDELKEGQERVLKELGEIKKLLLEKPGRVDYLAKPAAPNPISVNVHGEPFKGDSRARVAIMEYSDFDCSFCANYARDIYPSIEQEYIRPGKVKYFFRDLPEPAQTNSWLKACAARCAGEQGKFWEMHDLLFAAQSSPAGQDPGSLAQTLGLDIAKFSECLSSGRYSEIIRRSAAGAGRMGIFGTPAFLIGTLSADGDFLSTTNVVLGAESYAAFKSSLDELLTAPRPHRRNEIKGFASPAQYLELACRIAAACRNKKATVEPLSPVAEVFYQWPDAGRGIRAKTGCDLYWIKVLPTSPLTQ